LRELEGNTADSSARAAVEESENPVGAGGLQALDLKPEVGDRVAEVAK
jgi:hypothetical protein